MWGIPYLICVFLYLTADSLAVAASPYTQLGMAWGVWHRYLGAVVVVVYLLMLKMLAARKVSLYRRHLASIFVALLAGMIPLAQMQAGTRRVTLGDRLSEKSDDPWSDINHVSQRAGFAVVQSKNRLELIFPQDKDEKKLREVLEMLGIEVVD